METNKYRHPNFEVIRWNNNPSAPLLSPWFLCATNRERNHIHNHILLPTSLQNSNLHEWKSFLKWINHVTGVTLLKLNYSSIFLCYERQLWTIHNTSMYITKKYYVFISLYILLKSNKRREYSLSLSFARYATDPMR